MGILTDSTYMHMEAFTAVDKINRQLNRLERMKRSSEHTDRVIDQIASEALRLRRHLVGFFDRERRELFPRVRRIFGADVEELEQLRNYQREVVSRLDRFVTEITSNDDTDESVSHYKQLFGAFVDRYEQRCEMERSFYRSYSTILYPGGLATE